MARKINKQSKRQLRLRIKELKSQHDTLWKMVYRRDGDIKTLNDTLEKATGKRMMVGGLVADEFITGNEFYL